MRSGPRADLLTRSRDLLARLGVELTIDGRRLRARARPRVRDWSRPSAELLKAREILSALLERSGADYALRVEGLPYCFMPDARERMLYAPDDGRARRRGALCGRCRYADCCPGLPADARAPWSGLEPIPDAVEEVAVEVTRACNLTCGVCMAPRARQDGLASETIRRVVEEAAAAGVRVVRFTGGEPLLRRDLFDHLERAKALGLTVYLNTNGTLLGAATIARLSSCVDSALVSVQGFDAESDARLTGGRRFAEKLAALKALAATRISVRMDTVLSRTLLARRRRYVSILKDAGVRHWITNRPMLAGPGAGLAGPGSPGAELEAEYGLSREEILDAMRFLAGLQDEGISARIGNAVPYCVGDDEAADWALGANSVTEGRTRLVFDARGFYKPTYQLDVDLGATLAAAIRHPFRRTLADAARLPAECRACARLKPCLGGSRYLAWKASGDYGARDPLMRPGTA